MSYTKIEALEALGWEIIWDNEVRWMTEFDGSFVPRAVVMKLLEDMLKAEEGSVFKVRGWLNQYAHFFNQELLLDLFIELEGQGPTTREQDWIWSDELTWLYNQTHSLQVYEVKPKCLTSLIKTRKGGVQITNEDRWVWDNYPEKVRREGVSRENLYPKYDEDAGWDWTEIYKWYTTEENPTLMYGVDLQKIDTIKNRFFVLKILGFLPQMSYQEITEHGNIQDIRGMRGMAYANRTFLGVHDNIPGVAFEALHLTMLKALDEKLQDKDKSVLSKFNTKQWVNLIYKSEFYDTTQRRTLLAEMLPEIQEETEDDD